MLFRPSLRNNLACAAEQITQRQHKKLYWGDERDKNQQRWSWPGRRVKTATASLNGEEVITLLREIWRMDRPGEGFGDPSYVMAMTIMAI
ncbi:MAG: hypothetical protein B6D72_13795 [gamma proteobacterium symbiont of Ctena orbiculata]|nr:MAG: hypothetical protein B6D72_13795 [gamma proteobacterium symbiont of Ctena orbiculata]PVV16315.1 MAG: hypothetical protein B6D82_01285 [gamma proteobacterium symbiont of Ctena orbiculata]PVV26450.1 MAG: hypothetical protein B6D74_01295 [gamma proteobacterium symbiont of Ctena orbiculata]